MSDRHIRRTGSDYAAAYISLLPYGAAWSRDPTSVLVQACEGLNDYWGTVDGTAADLLEIESDPRTTTDNLLLPDWERNWGLPDPCLTGTLTVSQRQQVLVQRMTLLGAQSREFFIELAEQLGFTITISEFRPFMIGIDRCGDNRVHGDGTNPMFAAEFALGYLPVCDPGGNRIGAGILSEQPCYGLGAPELRFYWQVHVLAIPAGGDATDLECILNRWKPAHTQIVFDYSALPFTLDVSELDVGILG
jgi:uncharacterized protein YmfQ (DUF2313 family)